MIALVDSIDGDPCSFIVPMYVSSLFQGESTVPVSDPLSRVLHTRDSYHFVEPLLLGCRVLAIARLWPYSTLESNRWLATRLAR